MSSPAGSDGVCDSAVVSNATSCDGTMSYTITDLSADTNYTVLLTAYNAGGPSDERHVSVITQSQPGELVMVQFCVAFVILKH